MSKKVLRKEQKDIIKGIEDITPENINKIKEMLDDGYSLVGLIKELNSKMKKSSEIQKIIIQESNVNTLKGIIREFSEVGMSESDIFDIMRTENRDFFEQCLKNSRVPLEKKIQYIQEEPQLARYITEKDPIKEILKKQPQAGEFLSKKIQQTTEVLGDEAIGLTSFWKKDGETIQHFELGNDIKLNGREDYIKIVEAYIKEDKSIPQFCDKYMIENYSGFSSVVSKIENEDINMKEQILEVKQHAQRRYIESMKDLNKKILSGETTIREAINSRPRLRAYDFIESKEYMDEEDYLKIVKEMLREIGNTRTSLKKKEVDKYGVEYRLVGNLSDEELIKWFSYPNSKNPPEDAVIGIKKVFGFASYIKGLFHNNYKEIVERAESFEKKINEDELLNNISYIKNGEYVKPTKTNIQDAKEYLNATDKFLNQRNINSVLRAIIQEKLSKENIKEAKKEHEQKKFEKKQEKDRQLQRFKNVTSVEEYLNVFSKSKEVEIEKTKTEKNLKITLVDKTDSEDFEKLQTLLKKFVVDTYLRNKLEFATLRGKEKSEFINNAINEFDGIEECTILSIEDIEEIQEEIESLETMAEELIDKPNNRGTESRYYVLKDEDKIIGFQQAQVVKRGEDRIEGWRNLAYIEQEYAGKSGEVFGIEDDLYKGLYSEAIYDDIGKWFNENEVNYERTCTGVNMLSNIFAYTRAKGFLPFDKNNNNIFLEKYTQQKLEKDTLSKAYKLYCSNRLREEHKDIQSIMQEIEDTPEFLNLTDKQKEGLAKIFLKEDEKELDISKWEIKEKEESKEELFSSKEIGKAIINVPIEQKDEAKKQIQEDEKQIQQMQENQFIKT